MKSLLRPSCVIHRWFLVSRRDIKTSPPLSTRSYKNKNKKERSKVADNIYRFNQESLVLFGPVQKRLTESGPVSTDRSKRRIRKPLVEKEPNIDYDIEEAEKLVGDEQVDFTECVDEGMYRTSAGTITKHKSLYSNGKKDALHKKIIEINSDSSIKSGNSMDTKIPKSKSSDLLNGILAASFLPDTNELMICDSMIKLIGDVRTPSVSTILNETMPEESRRLLENWKRRKIAEMGLEAFEIEMDGIRRRGQDLHLSIENTLKGVPVSDLTITTEMEGFWESIQDVLCDVKDLAVTEAKILHPTLHYAGRLDCIAMYKGNLCLIDWKTSAKKKRKLEFTYDNPLQLAAYAGAVNAMDSFDYKIKHAVLVMMYPDGSPAHAHLMSVDVLEKYWRIWLQRVRLYWKLKQKL
ncbi:uncharacterized protein LOC135484960 [Lineus longissimus]|uniref:uncharacterized protein LOC135484960 n=1 Tax=Lineus longissimus TaxID=88925 RepID=UPI00315CAF6A